MKQTAAKKSSDKPETGVPAEKTKKSRQQKFTLQQIVELQAAFNVLGQSRLPIAYQVAKNLKRVGDVLQTINEEVKELRKMYCELDEQQNPKVRDGKLIFKSEEDEDAYKEQAKKFDGDKRAVDCHKIRESQVEGLTVEGAALAILFERGVIVPDADFPNV